MPASLILAERDLALIEAEARGALPREACGLLIGTGSAESGLVVERIVPAINVAAEDDRFEIDPAQLLRLHRDLRGTASRIIGHYHSHPGGGPMPSLRDRSASFTPGLVWLILGVSGTGPAIPAAYLHPAGQDPLLEFESMALRIAARQPLSP